MLHTLSSLWISFSGVSQSILLMLWRTSYKLQLQLLFPDILWLWQAAERILRTSNMTSHNPVLTCYLLKCYVLNMHHLTFPTASSIVRVCGGEAMWGRLSHEVALLTLKIVDLQPRWGRESSSYAYIGRTATASCLCSGSTSTPSLNTFHINITQCSAQLVYPVTPFAHLIPLIAIHYSNWVTGQNDLISYGLKIDWNDCAVHYLNEITAKTKSIWSLSVVLQGLTFE